MSEQAQTTAADQPNKSNKLPNAAYFLLVRTLLNSMSVFCIAAIYKFFLRNKLRYTTDETVSINHGMMMINFFLQPVGAFAVDSFYNKFIAIVILSILQACNTLLLTTISLPKIRKYGRTIMYGYWTFSALIPLLTGGAVGAFNGNQFKLPEQAGALRKFYFYNYVAHNISVMLAYYVSPKLKTDVSCFSEQDCYTLGFGVGFLFVVLQMVIFISGYKYYTISKPERNMMIDVFGCIGYGLVKWTKERKTNPRPYWLYHAQPKYDAQLIEDIRRFFRILIVFLTLPMYYTVYSQMDSKWLFQATRMDGRVGRFTIIPDYFQLVNPLLALVLTPIILHVIDPLIIRWKMDRCFRRMILGGVAVAISFVMSGLVESYMKTFYPVLPNKNEAQIRIINSLDCSLIIQASFISTPVVVGAMGVYTNKHVTPIHGNKSFVLTGVGSCGSFTNEEISLEEQKSMSFFINKVEESVKILQYEEEVSTTETGFPMLTVLGVSDTDTLFLQDSKDLHIDMEPDPTNKGLRLIEVVPDSYRLFWRGKKKLQFNMYLGGMYNIMLTEDSASLSEITPPNSVHMAWLLPQSVLLIFGEVYFDVSFAEFTYVEAPMSLKAVVLAMYLFAIGLGDFFIIVLTTFGTMDQDHEYYLSASIVFIDVVGLLFLAIRYKPTNEEKKLI